MSGVALYFLMLLVASAVFGLGFRAGVRFCFHRRAKKVLRGCWFKMMAKACNEGYKDAQHRDFMEAAAASVLRTKRCPRCELFYPIDMEAQHTTIDCPRKNEHQTPAKKAAHQ